jgi:hypothetical protein
LQHPDRFVRVARWSPHFGDLPVAQKQSELDLVALGTTGRAIDLTGATRRLWRMDLLKKGDKDRCPRARL